jgi:amino acid adenylation domain-containing protein
MVDLEADARLWAGEPHTNPDRASVGLMMEHLAYVIYTSGSTGTPKGIAIEHRSVVNFICWGRATFDLGMLERTLFSTSLNFDLAVYECFVPLSAGATIRMVENALDLGRSPADVTLINTVPSVMKSLVDTGGVPSSVRLINLAGEPLKQELVERIFAVTKAETVCNLYGPSETTTYSTRVEMKREDPFAAHIGRPIANTEVYIVDEQREAAPIGVAGELYIGGAGVARGYLNRPELTAERFVPDAFGREAGGRLYKSGDLARWSAAGEIEFVGRKDFQVKIRGYRIELGEIEATLTAHAQVREAVVVAREDQEAGKRLVAYYTGAETGAETLRAHLSSRLPDYMVPAAYIHLEAMPLTENGKLDRRALPVPGKQAYATRGYEPPIDETETRMAGIWADLLKLERVGRHDNFFDLGGHSLLLIELQNKLRSAFERDLRIVEMFKYPTVSGLAQYLTQGRNEAGRSLLMMERAKRRREALDRRSSRFSPAE